MRVICVDDEKEIAEETAALVGELPAVEEAMAFPCAEDALAWLEKNPADLALLDINMPGMNGLELAAAVRTRWPKTAILFLTGDPRYALEAFELRAAGYILKPATRERLEKEIEYACAPRHSSVPGDPLVTVRTFGCFDCFLDGRELSFPQAKCKELLAYLVDRRGGSVTRSEAFSILWDDRLYDRSMQKQLDGIIRSLRSALQGYGIASILEMRRGTMRICPERLQCDLYRFLDGDPDAQREYCGEYMTGYAWAQFTEGYMTRKNGG